MYPNGIINIYSINANKVFSKIPGDIFNVSIIAIKKIHAKKTKDIFKSAIYQYLNKKNYELISQYYQTSFFKINNFNP